MTIHCYLTPNQTHDNAILSTVTNAIKQYLTTYHHLPMLTTHPDIPPEYNFNNVLSKLLVLPGPIHIHIHNAPTDSKAINNIKRWINPPGAQNEKSPIELILSETMASSPTQDAPDDVDPWKNKFQETLRGMLKKKYW